MKTPLFGGSNGAPSTSAVNYVSIVGALTPTPVGTETSRQCVVPAAFTLSNLYVTLNNAPAGTASYKFTVRKNGVDTLLAVTITGSATNGADTADSVSFAAGDTISLSVTPTSTPTAPTYFLWNLQADSGGTHFAPLMGGAQATSNLSTSAVTYAALYGSSSTSVTWDATESHQEIICPTGGTISNLYVVSETAPGTSKSYAIALVQNGSITALSATVTGSSGKTGNDTSHSITVAAGDTLSIAATPTGTPTVGRYSWGFQFTPTKPGESFFGFGASDSPGNTSTQYEAPSAVGAGVFSGTETSRQLMPGACLMTAFYAALGTAPGGVTTRTLTLRRGAISSPLAIPFTGVGVSGNVLGQNVGLCQADLLSIQAAETGTPATDTGGVHMGVLMFIPVASQSVSEFLEFM